MLYNTLTNSVSLHTARKMFIYFTYLFYLHLTKQKRITRHACDSNSRVYSTPFTWIWRKFENGEISTAVVPELMQAHS